jgi:hypothetical protein
MTRQDDPRPAEGTRTPGSAEGERDLADQSNGSGVPVEPEPMNQDRPADNPDVENVNDASKD